MPLTACSDVRVAYRKVFTAASGRREFMRGLGEVPLTTGRLFRADRR